LHPDVASFLAAKEQLLLTAPPPRGMRPTALGNATALGSALLVARNSRQGRRLVREWWTSVDLHGDLPTQTAAATAGRKAAPAARPLRYFRVGGYQEQSVLASFVARRYPKGVQVLPGEGSYRSTKGRQHRPLMELLSKELAERQRLPCDGNHRNRTAPAQPTRAVAATDESFAEGGEAAGGSACVQVSHPTLQATCAECVVDTRGGSCQRCVQLGFQCDCACGASRTRRRLTPTAMQRAQPLPEKENEEV
jgi:hypothetical protein